MINRIVLFDRQQNQWLTFANPREILLAYDAAEVKPSLSRAESYCRSDSLYAAGFVSLEAASGFDESFVTQPPGSLPLVCLGIFEAPESSDNLPGHAGGAVDPPTGRLSEDQQSYEQHIAAIKREIECGNTYQVNYTVRLRLANLPDPWELFCSLAADAPYAAFIDGHDFAIVSASPELFFRLDGRTIKCKPMKGTAARGLTLAQDKILRDGLACSIKNRAENVMVADMIRNDLGRIAVPGSVQVESLYDVEKFPTVWQMTSTITAQTDSSITDVFGALFPSASITGAPKKSTLEIIAGIESSPREIYTGAIGYVAPGRAAQFNVAIRTVSIDKHNGSGVCGIGGGIVWDSDAGEEYEECRLKARWLLQPAATKQFRLLESMLWEPGRGIFLPDLHKTRLMRSIEYFDFDVTAEAIDDAFRAISGWSFKKKYKVRLLLTRDGQVELEKTPIPASSDKPEVRLALAEHPVSRNDVFLYHKTTRRNAYARAMQDASGADDVILWNEEGAITETTTCNIVVVIDGKAYTPPVTSGLLAGTYREWLLQNGEIEEREIFLDEISTCDELLVVNSVRRARTGRLIRGRR